METFFLILSAILFLISFGSILKHRVENPDSIMEGFLLGKQLLFLCVLLPLIMLFISINSLSDLKWYWNLIIVWVITGFKDIFSTLYSIFFGYKSKPTLDLIAGGMVRYNIYIIDALITFVLGLILFLII
jgi:hypothetical protein